jgi:hypothetical protein
MEGIRESPKGEEMKLEIFKTGKHQDSEGRVKEWTTDDLDVIASKYNEQKDHQAPVVIGHPQDNAPAFGWVEKVWRDGQTLFAEIKETVPEFIDWIKKGLYKKRSISLYPDLTLRHIGFLGAQPPAVKGLSDKIQFKDSKDNLIYEFKDWRWDTLANILRNLREWIIELKGVEEADKVIPAYSVDDIKTEPQIDQSANDFKEENMNELEEVKKQLAEKEKQLIAKEMELQTLCKAIAEKEKENRTKEYAQFCEAIIKDGKILPKDKDIIMAFLEMLHNQGDYKFSENETINCAKKFKDFLEGLPKQIDFAEKATKDKCAASTSANKAGLNGKFDAERAAIHIKAIEYMEAHPGTSYAVAVEKIIKEE